MPLKKEENRFPTAPNFLNSVILRRFKFQIWRFETAVGPFVFILKMKKSKTMKTFQEICKFNDKLEQQVFRRAGGRHRLKHHQLLFSRPFSPEISYKSLKIDFSRWAPTVISKEVSRYTYIKYTLSESSQL